MKRSYLVAAVVFQFISASVIAADQTANLPTVTVDPVKQVAPAPNEDYSGLFPGPGGAGNHDQVQQIHISQPPIPTYESWDVLRQYPRFAPVPKSVLKESTDGK